jgi:DNA-binding NtrC family response regulator
MRTRTGVVLVVEDERGVREPLAHLLELRDFEVVTAASVDEALAAIHSRPPDAAIVDLNLAEGSGRDVVESVPSSVPVIIFSGLPWASRDIEHTRPRTRLVEKPCSLTWLINTLSDMLMTTRPIAPA